jgi:hypothetical protein
MSNISECMGLLLLFDDKRLATYKATVVSQNNSASDDASENMLQCNHNLTFRNSREDDE